MLQGEGEAGLCQRGLVEGSGGGLQSEPRLGAVVTRRGLAIHSSRSRFVAHPHSALDINRTFIGELEKGMFVPKWLIAVVLLVFVAFASWSYLLAVGRNPLPFPDHGSRIFSAPTPEAKDAVVALLARHGLKERFQFNTNGVLRSIMWDGTIINQSSPDVLKKLDYAVASIGLVADDPAVSANRAAEFLRSRGFEAKVVLDAEPELPIAFVVTNAMSGTVLNFRKHVVHLPRPQSVGKASK